MYNKKQKHIPVGCGLYIKSDYRDMLEDKYESYSGEDIIYWFISTVNYYNKLFKDIFEIIFHLMKILLLHLLLSVSIIERTWVMKLLEIMII